MVTHTHADRQTDRNATHRPRPVQGLGWVKKLVLSVFHTAIQKVQIISQSDSSMI